MASETSCLEHKGRTLRITSHTHDCIGRPGVSGIVRLRAGRGFYFEVSMGGADLNDLIRGFRWAVDYYLTHPEEYY